MAAPIPLSVLCAMVLFALGDGSTPAYATEPSASPVRDPVPQALLLDFIADPSAFTLVDARSPEEYAASHLDGAINIPYDSLEQHADALPDTLDRSLLLYCRSGRRAGLLAEQLVALGYTDVHVLGPDQVQSDDGVMILNRGADAEPPARE